MAHAQKSIVIDVTPEQLFDVVVDYEKYPQFLPEVKSAKVTFGSGSIKEVTYSIDIKAKVISYTLKHTAEKPGKVSWSFVRGEMMKGNDGSWTLKPAPGGGTEATYSIDLKLSALVPSFIEKALAEQQLPLLLANFKKRAESLHPKTA